MFTYLCTRVYARRRAGLVSSVASMVSKGLRSYNYIIHTCVYARTRAGRVSCAASKKSKDLKAYIYIKYVHVFMLEGELVVFLQVNECLC